MIHHFYTSYVPKDPDTLRRNKVAQETWKRLPWVERPVSDDRLSRMWEEEGRRLPYVRDVFNCAADGLQDNEILIYTNADIHVRSDTCVAVACLLQSSDAAYCFRRDFGRLDAPLTDEQYAKGFAYAGHDLTAFRVGWWRHWQHAMPDMILGLEAWDPCIRILIDRTNYQRPTLLHDLIGHERHPSYWENPANRYRLKGQKYCLDLARKFMRSYGVNPRSHGIPST